MIKKRVLKSSLVCTACLGFIGLCTFTTNVNASVSSEEIQSSQEISMDSEGVIVSDVMTKSEMIQSISEEFNISKEQAEKSIFKGNERMERKETTEGYVLVRAYQDFQINNSVEGGTAYFYCEISASGGFRAIKKIIYAGFNHPTYQFAGTLQYGLPDPNRIHYTLNGNLYSHTTMTVTGGSSVGVLGTGSLNYSVASTSNHKKNVFVTRNVYF